MIYGITYDKAEGVWPFVREFLNRACDYTHGQLNDSDLLEAVIKRNMQLWVVIDGEVKAAAVTEIINHPRKRECRIIALGGKDMGGWFDDLITTITKWAKSYQCDFVTGSGRKGWVRAAKHLGFVEAYTTVLLEI